MVELGLEHRTGVCKVQVLFFTIFCYFSAENANELQGGEEGSSGSGWFEDGPGKAPRPSNGLPVCPSGNPGMSCNWSESPREKTDVPQAEKAEPASPTLWAMALQEDWAVGPNPC